MKRALSVLTIALLLLAGVVLAANGYDLSWHAISGGGGHSATGNLALDGAVLQPAGVLHGGGYEAQTGFWPGAAGAAAPTVALRFSPAHKTIYRCSSPFTVDVDVRDVSNLGGFEFALAFDPTVVHVEDIALGTFLTSGPRTFTPVGPVINNATGTATFGAFSFGAQPAPSGSGPIATLTFSVVEVGSSALGLTSFQLTDPNAVVIPAAAEGGSLTVLPGLTADVDCDCDVDIVDIMLVASRWGSVEGDPNYDPLYDRDSDGDVDIVDIMLVASHWGETCDGAAPTKGEGPERAPHERPVERAPSNAVLTIEPSSTAIAPGDVLTVQVLTDEVADLGGFEFTLQFDGQVLQAEEAVLGDLLQGTGRSAQSLQPLIDNDRGLVRCGGFSFGGEPGASGAGLLAQIRLRAVGTGSSKLALSSVQLVDSQAHANTPALPKEVTVVVSGRTPGPLPEPTLVLPQPTPLRPQPTKEAQ